MPLTSLEVAPDGHAEIIFSFGGPCSVATPTGWQLLPSSFLVGLLRQLVHSQKNQLRMKSPHQLPPEILVAGASIAGLTAAYWLTQAGYRVTVVELAAAPVGAGPP